MLKAVAAVAPRSVYVCGNTTTNAGACTYMLLMRSIKDAISSGLRTSRSHVALAFAQPDLIVIVSLGAIAFFFPLWKV